MPIINRYLKGQGGGEPHPRKKYGMDINDIFGDVDENGVLLPCAQNETEAIFSGIGSLGSYSMYGLLGGATGVKTVKFPDITFLGVSYSLCEFAKNSTTIEDVEFTKCKYINATSVLDNAFSYSAIKNLSFPALEYITSTYTFNACCNYAPNLESIYFPKLRYIASDYAFQMFSNRYKGNIISFPALEYSYGRMAMSGAFTRGIFTKIDFRKLHASCTTFLSAFSLNEVIEYVEFPALTLIKGLSGVLEFNYCFQDDDELKKISFPMLQKAISPEYCFSSGTFNNCRNLTEIHFRTDATDLVPTLNSYSTQWGATNATIYYDLISKIQDSQGNDLVRDEDDSLYDANADKTYIAWERSYITADFAGVFYRNPKRDHFAWASPYDVMYAWSKDDTSSGTIWTKSRRPTVGTLIYVVEDGTAQSGNVTSLNTNVVYTVASKEPEVGDYYYNENGEQVGTISQIS